MNTTMRGFRTMLTLTALGLAGQAGGDWQETHVLTPADGLDRDYYGAAASISDGVAIVGAYGDDTAASDAGAAYLIDTTTGQQLHKLIAADAGAFDNFGFSVGISGGLAVVGAPGEDEQSNGAGAVYVFDVATGQQLHKLAPEDPGVYAEFGTAVAISGDIAILGTPLANLDTSDSGAAYLFDVVTGQQLHKLTASDAAAYDYFGWSVSISGGLAIVGAPLDDDNEPGSGSVYVFDVASGQQVRKLTAGDPSQSDALGTAVSISGTIAVAGIRQVSPWDHGSAYVFDVTTGQQLHELTAEDSSGGDEFGTAVSISGDVVVVGARENTDEVQWSGAAYLFDAASGELVQKLLASDAESNDLFGHAVSISDGTVIVGASRTDEPDTDAGSAYVYRACPADLDGDGSVTTTDLIAVILNWGCTGPCPGDASGDGIVDVLDVVEVVLNWGQCG